MTPEELSGAEPPFARGSLAAMHRVADEARRIAIETSTGIIVMRDGKTVRLAAKELRQQMPPK